MDPYTERLLEKIAALESEPLLPTGNGHTAPLEVFPIVTFSTLAARPRDPLRFLITGIVPEAEAILISARERMYKSFLTMEMALAVALGRPFLGRYTVPQARRVIMFDLENRRARLCDRVEAALARDGLTCADLDDRLLLFDREHAPGRWRFEAQTLGVLTQTLDVWQPALIIIDNLRKATPPGKDESAQKDMLPVIDSVIEVCEHRDVAVIIVHHDRRDGSGASGSGVLLSTPGNYVQVKQDRVSRISTVVCDSMRNAEPFPPFAVVMGKDGALRLTDVPEADGDGAQPGDHRATILAALRQGGMTVGEMAQETGLTPRQIRPTLKGLLAAGSVVIGHAKRSSATGSPAVIYGLPAHGA